MSLPFIRRGHTHAGIGATDAYQWPSLISLFDSRAVVQVLQVILKASLILVNEHVPSNG